VSKTVKTIAEYIEYLTGKGFTFGEDVIGFIQFGQNYTNTEDEMVIIAIELTLKIQKQFDGSFFISLLEMFKKEDISNRKQAMNHIHMLNLI
jgi:Family of unknown function (DUF6123)